MKNLLVKELRLAMHPATLLFLCLSALILIPNYPYYVTFFYTCLGVFFLCLNGRENHDIEYTALLPIRKREIVKARFLAVLLVEIAQVLLAIPFLVLRSHLIPEGNAVGMDANLALLGFSLLLLGLFNLFFFTRYYRDPSKVGAPFLLGCAVFTAGMLLVETAVHVVPWFREHLDTPDPQFLLEKVFVLAVGAALFALFNLLAYQEAARSFEAIDL